MSAIWVNMDGCAEQIICATGLYLLSMLAHAYNIIIDCGVGAPGHVREVVYGLNDNYKRLISMLMKTVQMTRAASYDSHMVIHTSTETIDISLAR